LCISMTWPVSAQFCCSAKTLDHLLAARNVVTVRAAFWLLILYAASISSATRLM
jgi:hypothetical protein